MDRRLWLLSHGLFALCLAAQSALSADVPVCEVPAVAVAEMPSPFAPVGLHTENRYAKWRHGFHHVRNTWDHYFEVYPKEFANYEAARFEKVREEPSVYVSRRIEFDLYFGRTGSYYRPFLTPYNQDLFINFSAWPYGSDLWLKEARANSHPLFYADRVRDELVDKILHLPMFTPIHVWGEVGSKSENTLWVEIKRLEIIPETALNEKTLRQIELGFMQFEKKHYELTIQTLETALKLEIPVQAEAKVYSLLSKAYFELHQYVLARNAAVNALMRNEDNIPDLLQLALTDLRLGKADEAREAAQRVIVAEPSNPVAHAQLGLALGMLGDIPNGYTEVDFAESLAPHHQLAIAYRNRAKLALLENKLEMARDELNRAVILMATDVELKLELGDVFVRLNDWEKAQLNYSQARDLEPQRAEPYYKVAFVLKAKGDAAKKDGKEDVAKKLYEEALENVNNAILRDKGMAPAHLLKVDLLKALGRDDEARKAAEIGAKNAPANAALQELVAPPPPPPAPAVVVPETTPPDAKPKEAVKDAVPDATKPVEATSRKPAPPVIEDLQGNDPVPIKVPGPR